MAARLALMMAVLLLLAIPVRAQEAYRWVDEKGVVHFTDDYSSIPEKYRGQVEKRSMSPDLEAPAPSLPPSVGLNPPFSVPQLFRVPFTRVGNHMIVSGIVNRERTAEFILDTGASLTTISPALARQAGIDPDRGLLIPVRTASDVIVVPLVEIDSLNVAGAEVKDLDATVQDIPGLEGRGLLGGSFLSEFRVDINYEGNRLTLERHPGPYGGHSAAWWRRKFRSYARYRELYEDILSGALRLPGYKFQKLRDRASDLLQAVEDRINDLEIRASQAGVPRSLRDEN